MAPKTYAAKGRSSRSSAMDDSFTVTGNSLTLTQERQDADRCRRRAVVSSQTATPPVAMQEQMMRWWLSHGKPAEFTAYPSQAKVHTSNPPQLLP